MKSELSLRFNKRAWKLNFWVEDKGPRRIQKYRGRQYITEFQKTLNHA